jgi:hypothetical protein
MGRKERNYGGNVLMGECVNWGTNCNPIYKLRLLK